MSALGSIICFWTQIIPPIYIFKTAGDKLQLVFGLSIDSYVTLCDDSEFISICIAYFSNNSSITHTVAHCSIHDLKRKRIKWTRDWSYDAHPLVTGSDITLCISEALPYRYKTWLNMLFNNLRETLYKQFGWREKVRGIYSRRENSLIIRIWILINVNSWNLNLLVTRVWGITRIVNTNSKFSTDSK